MAHQSLLRRVEDASTDEVVANDIAKKLGNHVRYSETFNYVQLLESVREITAEIREITDTEENSYEGSSSSDDSGCSKGEKAPNPRIFLGDEVKAVFSSNVLFRIPEANKRCVLLMKLLMVLQINIATLRAWNIVIVVPRAG